MHKVENESDSSYAFQREHAEKLRVVYVEATKNESVCREGMTKREISAEGEKLLE